MQLSGAPPSVLLSPTCEDSAKKSTNPFLLYSTNNQFFYSVKDSPCAGLSLDGRAPTCS